MAHELLATSGSKLLQVVIVFCNHCLEYKIWYAGVVNQLSPRQRRLPYNVLLVLKAIFRSVWFRVTN